VSLLTSVIDFLASFSRIVTSDTVVVYSAPDFEPGLVDQPIPFFGMWF
jgi:hypothetical protein